MHTMKGLISVQKLLLIYVGHKEVKMRQPLLKRITAGLIVVFDLVFKQDWMP